jgi:hypothetical protein
MILPLVEDEKCPERNAGKTGGVIPLEGVIEVGDGKDREDRKGDDLLNCLKLRAGEFIGAEYYGISGAGTTQTS